MHEEGNLRLQDITCAILPWTDPTAKFIKLLIIPPDQLQEGEKPAIRKTQMTPAWESLATVLALLWATADSFYPLGCKRDDFFNAFKWLICKQCFKFLQTGFPWNYREVHTQPLQHTEALPLGLSSSPGSIRKFTQLGLVIQILLPSINSQIYI